MSPITLRIFHQSIPAVPTPYHNLVWCVLGRYLEFYFSPGGVHCPWKAQKCLVRALSSIPFLCVLETYCSHISTFTLIVSKKTQTKQTEQVCSFISLLVSSRPTAINIDCNISKVAYQSLSTYIIFCRLFSFKRNV